MNYTWVINSYKNLPYLKLAIASIRKNAHYKGMPIIVYTENDPETAAWIGSQPDIQCIIETNEVPKGIGGGVNEAIKRVETTYFNLIHSDMYISPHYDKPLYELVRYATKPTVACAWRLEPNIWNQGDRLGTTMAPANAQEGFGMYHHDFQAEPFEIWSGGFVRTNQIRFRKVEGVSYMMKKTDWDRIGGNDPRYAPSSYEDHQLSVRMQCEGYEFVVTSEAVVWHFGSRGANFMEQNDKLTHRSARQIECEQRNLQKWIEEWGSPPQYDNFGFVVVTDEMRKRYEKNREKYKFI